MRLAVFRGRLDAGVVIPPQWHGANDLQVYLAPASVGGRVLEATIDADLSRLARGTKPLEVAVVYPGGGRGGALPLGFQYTAPANLVLFVIINGLVSALSIIELRRSGLSQRLLATPARRWELFAMLTVGPFQQMVAQAVFLILLTRLFFGVHWGDPLGVLMVTAAVICLGVSLVLLMGTVFRTPQQPVSLGPWIGVFLGMLGGTSWPLEVVPPFMRTVGHSLARRVGHGCVPGADLRSRLRARNHAGRDGAFAVLRSACDYRYFSASSSAFEMRVSPRCSTLSTAR